ncbi:hypothetical protein VQ643_04240 [Pseudomonas sp. F1_0610]|uniref:hypothetical protein n=1 Tax=Pseudomonas sp. F1_0610 TaxID=3114284 RepID=UPI0039C2692A
MADPATSTAAASGAVLKYFGLHISAGALAAALGFLILWPKTVKEGFARLFVAISSSSILGPMLVVRLHASNPELFASANEVASLYGLDPNFGLLFVASPLLVIAGLPAWWLIGAALRIFERDGESWIGAFANWIRRKLENKHE